MKLARRSLLATLPGLLSACASIGPLTIVRDQRDYTEAIADAAKRQVLGAVVRLRYGDHVSFLDIGSVVAGYQFETGIGTGTALTSGLDLGENVRLSVDGRYVDRPTITWQPVAGAALSERLLQPLPPGVIAVLGLTGYPPEMVFGLTVSSMNGLSNGSTRPGESIPAHPRWEIVIDRFRVLRTTGVLGIRTERDGLGRPRFVLVDESRGTDRRVQDIRILLGLDPEENEFPLVYGSGAGDGHEIRMITRPLLEVLLEVAGRIKVPAADVESGRTPATVTDVPSQPVLRIEAAQERPEDPYVEVDYGDGWFWIDDRDYASKRTFTLLMLLVSLAQTDSERQQPLLTIPTG
ncbi:MAG TPA: hypothetical protein VNS22_02275 [Geminicoccus sp.]|uniref:hypothetical protein n=1 Tax=Geminicoccus sp. TaxID=2024832 RepID=UPI002B6280CA|nr:hypothetical protein [Geminicoccus sp.]HWL67190.1 hypothetical protein [Geminicoccus sp.]